MDLDRDGGGGRIMLGGQFGPGQEMGARDPRTAVAELPQAGPGAAHVPTEDGAVLDKGLPGKESVGLTLVGVHTEIGDRLPDYAGQERLDRFQRDIRFCSAFSHSLPPQRTPCTAGLPCYLNDSFANLTSVTDNVNQRAGDRPLGVPAGRRPAVRGRAASAGAPRRGGPA